MELMHSSFICLTCIIILGSNVVLVSTDVETGEQGTGEVCIPTDLYTVFLQAVHTDVSKIQDKDGLVQRFNELETKLNLYEEDRRQMFHYFDVITQTIKRVTTLETEFPKRCSAETNIISLLTNQTEKINTTLSLIKGDVRDLDIRISYFVNEERERNQAMLMLKHGMDVVLRRTRTHETRLDNVEGMYANMNDIPRIVNDIRDIKRRLIPQECKYSENGIDYRGYRNITKTGKTCQQWAYDYPHEHDHHNIEGNYCRNTDDGDYPWCYTTDPEERWEYCDIPYC